MQRDAQLNLLVREIFRGLNTEVYDEQSVRIISLTKTILDLPTLSIKLHQTESADGGYIKVAVTEFSNFNKAVKEIPIRSLTHLPEDILQKQFTEFLRKLEKITEKYKAEELRKLDPKELLKKFFNPDDKLFQGIEMIMQAIAVSAVKQLCESVLESLVSKYENHFNRNLAEGKVNDAFFVAVNGPSLGHCDSVVECAMDRYWKSRQDWHFYKTTALEKLKKFDGDSKVLTKMLNEDSKFKCME